MSDTPLRPEGMVLALDPGITTGWARFTPSGRLKDWGNTDFDSTMSLIGISEVTALVYEDYRLRYSQKAPVDSAHTASQLIGAVKLRRLLSKGLIRIWPQEVEVLTVEAMHLGLERPKEHKTGHYFDAVLHGAYFFRRAGVKPDVTALDR